MRLPIFVLVTICGSACTGEPNVSVDGEMLHGKYLPDFGAAAFLGVPFAAPPVGDLRWRAPQPYEPDSDSRQATDFAPACMQKMRILEWYRDMAELAGNDRNVVADLAISEDCLYLNVWTPNPDQDAKLPVMVYVYGGSNSSGWSFEPNYHGHALAEQDVVVVSIPYRVGDFGFFAHPELDDGDAVANFGLWDQIAALEWIQKNISLFGGDPSRVTIFGESAGAEDIVALMFSHHADGLFDRAILQSPAGFGLVDVNSLADERGRGASLAIALGDGEPLTLEQLRAIPAAEFLDLSDKHAGDYYRSPVLDGVLLDKPAIEKLATGDYRKRPIIIGTDADEWYTSTPEDADREFVERTAKELFPGSAEAALRAVESQSDPRRAADRLMTAAYMLCPSQFFARELAAAGSDAWMYLFSRIREDAVGDEWRAYHGTELSYVFGTHDPWMLTTEADLRVTRDSMSYWLQFAKTGNPNSNNTAEWPTFSPPDFTVQDIDAPVRTIGRPDASLCEIYTAGLPKQ